jgi:hypothetical protein
MNEYNILELNTLNDTAEGAKFSLYKIQTAGTYNFGFDIRQWESHYQGG